MFADDTLLVLICFYNQFEMLFAIVDEFAFFSGCRNNLSESQVIFVGSERQESEKLHYNMGFTWTTRCFKYLGIYSRFLKN